ncbi:hypothetical protein [Roseateles sp.]|uniref:hypothetical protein n=1 Tax=Roseateles sp. TaxID=1971397 RepID=UPI003262F36B
MHVVIAASALPLFVGALLSDWAYSHSFQIQWINFSSWLIAGALLLTGIALAWALVDVLRRRSGIVYPLLLAATFVVGFFNALVHARDAWATMPTGLALSAVVAVLAVIATGVGLAAWHRRPA